MTLTAIRVAIFPSAGSVHLYHADEAGTFAANGLDVELVEVGSSDEQMALWDSGEVQVMHTAIDHLLRPRAGDPVAVRAEGVGELVVHGRAGIDPARARWAVDGQFSAFSLVLQAVVDQVTGERVDPDRLVPIGGTKQRFESLVAGEVDGTTLHAPFDAMAEDAGFGRVGGHLDVVPDLVSVVAVARREDVGSERLQRYLRACTDSVTALLDGGEAAIAAALERRGFPPSVAAAAAPQLVGPAGLARPSRLDRVGLLASVDLRERFVPNARIDRDGLDRLLAPSGA